MINADHRGRKEARRGNFPMVYRFFLVNHFILLINTVSGAVFVAENEQEARVLGSGAAVRVGHVVRDVRRAAAVRQAGGRGIPCVRRLQTGRPVGRLGFRLGGLRRTVQRSLCHAPVARQAARVCRVGRGTGPGRRSIRAAGRDPGGLATRGRGYRQATSACRRRRSVQYYLPLLFERD